MAGLPPDPVVTGAILILHDTRNNTILMGEEGKELFDDKDKTSNYYRYHPVLTQPLNENLQLGTATRKYTLEELTTNILPLIMKHISTYPPSKSYTLGTNLLFPIVALSREKIVPPIPNVSNYFSRPRIQVGLKEGCPKGGIKPGETALECIKREIYEEIGDIFSVVPLTDKDWIRDGAGNRYVTDVRQKSGPEPYAIFYKQVNPTQIQAILSITANRRAKFIGEVFDFVFKRSPPPPSPGRDDGVNVQTRNAVTKINALLASLGKQQIGGRKKTRRSHPKRRTTSKRR
jgi:hypothetical protein